MRRATFAGSQALASERCASIVTRTESECVTCRSLRSTLREIVRILALEFAIFTTNTAEELEKLLANIQAQTGHTAKSVLEGLEIAGVALPKVTGQWKSIASENRWRNEITAQLLGKALEAQEKEDPKYRILSNPFVSVAAELRATEQSMRAGNAPAAPAKPANGTAKPAKESRNKPSAEALAEAHEYARSLGAQTGYSDAEIAALRAGSKAPSNAPAAPAKPAKRAAEPSAAYVASNAPAARQELSKRDAVRIAFAKYIQCNTREDIARADAFVTANVAARVKPETLDKIRAEAKRARDRVNASEPSKRKAN